MNLFIIGAWNMLPSKNLHLIPLHPETTIATVSSMLSEGAIVIVMDGQKAFLSWQEVWPSFRQRDRFADFKVVEELFNGIIVARAETAYAASSDGIARTIKEGDKITVIPHGHAFGYGCRLSVSHARVYNDPLREITKWNDRDIKSFIVESVTESHAWGTLAPGIRVRVPLKDFEGILPDESWHGHQIPLLGDEIAGSFLHANVDDKEQIVTLDYATYIKSHVGIRDSLHPDAIKPVQILLVNNQEISSGIVSEMASHMRIRKLLIVDDDPEFLSSISQYIQNNYNICVLPSKDNESANLHIFHDGPQIDMAIIDVNLGTITEEKKDHCGIRIAYYLRDLFPACPIVLTTGEEINPKHPNIIEHSSLTVQDIVYKPFGTDSLYRALSAAGKEAKSLSDICFPVKQTTKSVAERKKDFQETLRDFKDYIGAETTVLFRICPITDEVRQVAILGPQHRHDLYNKQKLAWSPIRDAAIRGEEIFTSNATESSIFPKHRYLFYAFQYKSCVGAPVKTEGPITDAYAIFAFHQDADRFAKDLSLTYTRLIARELALNLRLVDFEEEIRQMKPFEMMGQAYGSMAHDLSKYLSSGFMLDGIIDRFAAGDLEGVKSTLGSAKSRLQQAQQIVRSFRDMARGQHEEVTTFPVKKSIGEIINRLQSEMRDYRTTLTMSLDVPENLSIRMRHSHLEQILTNLIFNAGQQIDRLPATFNRKGEVLVTAAVEIDSHGLSWLILQIHDNGPGIHRRDFERVFNLHYTTKEEGCGMGLDICRKIAAEVKFGKYFGTVRVSRSIFLCGSTFEVRLPNLQKGMGT